MKAETIQNLSDSVAKLYFADVLTDSEDKKIRLRINKLARANNIVIKDIAGNVVN